jgi:dihydroorotate dehydrogenase
MHWLFGRIWYILWSYKRSRRIVRTLWRKDDPSLRQTIGGIIFPRPLGLAAGFDKDGHLIGITESLWFGFTTVWSITALPYEWNPWRHLYRLPHDKALIVNYGLKNQGTPRILQRITKTLTNIEKQTIPIVLSIAKTNCRATIEHQAWISDYLRSIDQCTKAWIGQVLELNISCPNAFGWEDYTAPDRLHDLLDHVTNHRTTNQRKAQLRIKLPIDKPRTELKKLIDIAAHYKIDGLTLANLTKNRDTLRQSWDYTQIMWAISGKPTAQLSTYLIAKTFEHVWDKMTIIGVWGIFNADDAREKIRAWASLIELITGMIYQGPQTIGEIHQGLIQNLRQHGYTSIRQAIGTWSQQICENYEKHLSSVIPTYKD